MINGHQEHADRRKRVPFYSPWTKRYLPSRRELRRGTITHTLNRTHGHDQLPMGTQTKSETVRLTHQWRVVTYAHVALASRKGHHMQGTA